MKIDDNQGQKSTMKKSLKNKLLFSNIIFLIACGCGAKNIEENLENTKQKNSVNVSPPAPSNETQPQKSDMVDTAEFAPPIAANETEPQEQDLEIFLDSNKPPFSDAKQFCKNRTGAFKEISSKHNYKFSEQLALKELERLGIEITSQYKQWQVDLPCDLTKANWNIKFEKCKDGGYSLSAYRWQTLNFVGFIGKEICGGEPVRIFAITTNSTVVCVYKAFSENIPVAPGILSVKERCLSP